MNRCVIITAYVEGGINKNLMAKLGLSPNDFIICADGGYDFAKASGLVPNLLIGDFDSIRESLPHDMKKLIYPSEKDDTDTMLCVKYAVENNFDSIQILGGIGGRLDHTLSNLQSMSWAIDFWQIQKMKNKKISMLDSQNHVMLISNETIELTGTPCEKISLVSYSDSCTGVSISPAKWPLLQVILTNSFPLGISNEFVSDTCKISVETGKLLIIQSVD